VFERGFSRRLEKTEGKKEREKGRGEVLEGGMLLKEKRAGRKSRRRDLRRRMNKKQHPMPVSLNQTAQL